MVKSGKRKRKNSTTPESQVEAKAVAPVVGAGENGTLAACINRPSIEDKYSASNSIPTEIIFNVLLFLPASILRDIMRFVCKEWNAIISDPLFIRAHLCHSLSSPGLAFLVQDKHLHDAVSQRAFYIHTNDNDATGGWSELKLPFKAAILGSCNGLVLLQNAMTRKARKDLFVVNLVTKAKTRLPSLNRAGVRIICMPSTTLAFAPSSGQYKVVYVSFVSKDKQAAYVDGNIEHLCATLEVKVLVCTIVVDKTWRAIDSKGITMNSDVKMTLMSKPLSSSAGGHIYWFHKCHSHGLALDVDAETMCEFAGPKDYLINFHFTDSVKTDTGVGVVHLHAPDRHWKVWEVIEPKTGTWGRATDIDAACMYSAVESHFNPCKFGFIVPLLFSLRRGELWVFCVVKDNYRLVCYNWKTGNIWSPPIRWPLNLAISHLHVNSLLSVKNL